MFNSSVNNSRGKRSRGTACAGAEQDPKKGRIHTEEGAGNQETQKEAFKQVKNSQTAIHRARD